jgi:glycosyltransferase involved in cell wall biosynthesis
MNTKPSISAFFPAYNEEKNIGQCISETVKVLSEVTDTYEVIVIDDGSKDNTAKIVENYAHENAHVKLIRHQTNKGYGDALKTGLKAVKYEYIFFTDSDLQFDLSELKKFTQYIPEYDVVIGYRQNRRDPKIRLINAKLWNIVNRIMFGLKVKDIDCAFKLFRKDLMDKIVLTTGGAMTSAEMLLKFNDLGATIKELPVTHLPRTMGSQTGANIKVILRAFKEMWRLYSVEMGEKTQIQFMKFAIVGILNTATTLFIYALLTRFTSFFILKLTWAEAISYGAGMIVSFKFNRSWTFREHWKTNYKEVLRFLITNFSALLANVLVFYLLVTLSQINDFVAVTTSAVVTVAWNFLLSKYWVFKKTV